jgi:hypothetical protein
MSAQYFTTLINAFIFYPLRFTLYASIILVSCFLFLVSFSNPAYAQTNATQKPTEQVLNSVLNSFGGCMVAGISFIPEEPCSGNPVNSSTSINQNSGLGIVFQGISYVSTPPLSTTEYLADVGSNLGLIKPAYAQDVQGSGNNILLPVKKLWSIIRNFSYLMFTFIFMFVGLMVMFRRKLNPQTVMSIQSALPGLIIGLILVTFSYLISAAIIDLTFVFIPIVAAVFQQAGDNFFKHNIMGDVNLIELAQNANLFSFWYAVVTNPEPLGLNLLRDAKEASDKFPAAASGSLSNILNGNILLVLQSMLGGLLNALVYLVFALGNILIATIIVIALFIQMLRLLMALVRAYISILVYTILSPLIILIASIPGKGGMLSTWWKTLLANALIFPAVFAAFFLAGLILGTDGIDASLFNNGVAVVGSESFYTLPFFTGIPVSVLKYVIGYGLILGIPAIPQMVKEGLGVKDLKGIPETALQGFGAGAQPVTKFLGKASGYERLKKDRQAYEENIYRQLATDPNAWTNRFGKGPLGWVRKAVVTSMQPSNTAGGRGAA